MAKHKFELYILFAAGVFLFGLVDAARSNQDGPVQEPLTVKSKAASNSNPAKILENWQKLDDTKTGLQPRAPFLVQRDEETDFVREFIRVQWRPADPIDLWVMRPRTSAEVPVVLYLYSYSEDADRFRDDGWCERVTADGFAAVGFVSALSGQRYHNRPMKQWFVSELTESLGSTVHDVQLILNYLGDRGDMDMERVGMFGMGSGATIAILAAQADSRIKALDLLDPWADWPDWLKESPVVPENERSNFTTSEFLNSITPLDPIAYFSGLKTPRIRLQQTLSEPITPKLAKVRIAGSLPQNAQLVQYVNPEEHLKAWEAGGGLSGWIKQQLHARAQTKLTAGGQESGSH